MRSLTVLRACVFVSVLALVGVLAACETLDDWRADNPGALQQGKAAVQVLGDAAAPATGGLSALAASILVNIGACAFAVNRLIVAQRRAKTIAEIDQAAGTPSAAAQASTKAAVTEAVKITGHV